MSSQHSNTPDNDLIPEGGGLQRPAAQIRELGMKVLHGSERFLLAAGLIFVLVYVCSRIYATAVSQAGLWSFSQLQSATPAGRYDEHGRAVDFSLWTGERVKAYKQALAARG
jgi:hypothetical protein